MCLQRKTGAGLLLILGWGGLCVGELYKSSLHIVDVKLLLDMWFAGIFSRSVVCHFTFLIRSFDTGEKSFKF